MTKTLGIGETVKLRNTIVFRAFGGAVCIVTRTLGKVGLPTAKRIRSRTVTPGSTSDVSVTLQAT